MSEKYKTLKITSFADFRKHKLKENECLIYCFYLFYAMGHEDMCEIFLKRSNEEIIRFQWCFNKTFKLSDARKSEIEDFLYENINSFKKYRTDKSYFYEKSSLIILLKENAFDLSKFYKISQLDGIFGF